MQSKTQRPHVLENTSYAPRPNQENLATTLADNDNLNTEQATFASLDLNDETGREALYHKIIAAKKFTSFDDFCETATDNEWEEFRAQLLEAATGVEDGVRFIFRNDQASFFQVQALGGENLAQDGQINAKNGAPGRWFDDISTPAPI